MPWLRSRAFDLTFFIGPAVLSLLLVLPALLGLWPEADTPAWAWVLLVLCVDVAHVWTSLYRVYLDPEEFKRRRALYLTIPAAVYLLGLLLYAVKPTWFWTVLAYVALHHFVKQQIGFIALYRHRAGHRDPLTRQLDNLAVYTGTLVPVLYWHTHLPRNFAWFMEGDFIGGLDPAFMSAAWIAYGAVGAAWIGKRLLEWRTGGGPEPGRDLTMAATWATWGVGIVVLDSDFAFTATNVLIHGIPYMALIWHSTREVQRPALARLTRRASTFVGLVFLLAFVEEALWDAMVWREHAMIFGDWSEALPSAESLALFAVPLLTVPQATHYVLDGFIWRMDGSNPGLRARLFQA